MKHRRCVARNAGAIKTRGSSSRRRGWRRAGGKGRSLPLTDVAQLATQTWAVCDRSREFLCVRSPMRLRDLSAPPAPTLGTRFDQHVFQEVPPSASVELHPRRRSTSVSLSVSVLHYLASRDRNFDCPKKMSASKFIRFARLQTFQVWPRRLFPPRAPDLFGYWDNVELAMR